MVCVTIAYGLYDYPYGHCDYRVGIKKSSVYKGFTSFLLLLSTHFLVFKKCIICLCYKHFISSILGFKNARLIFLLCNVFNRSTFSQVRFKPIKKGIDYLYTLKNKIQVLYRYLNSF